MLLKINKFDKSESKYCCDRCKTLLSPMNRYTLYVAEGIREKREKWDLCKNCYRLLEKGIEKGVQKNEIKQGKI